MGHLKYLKYNGFLSFVLRKLNETNSSFLCLVVRDVDYTLRRSCVTNYKFITSVKTAWVKNNYKNQCKKNRVNDMAYTKEGTDGQILRSSKWIVIVIMIFEKIGLWL